MKVDVDTMRLAKRSHLFAHNMVRDMMQRCRVMLTGEDRDAVMRLTEHAFCCGFMACLEELETERTVREGVAVVRAVDRTRPKRVKP